MKFATLLTALLTLSLAGAIASPATAADSVVYVVRHAERADASASSSMANDPPLSAAGAARAERLASLLRSAGIERIIVTEYQRTRQTAMPLATQLKIEPVMASAKDSAHIADVLKTAGGSALVVGHSNTVPEILKLLGVVEPITIAEADYDNLFVVIRHPDGTAMLLRLHF